MTSDEFGSRYKLLKQMTVKNGRSYTAEHLASGRAVLVHILDEDRIGGRTGLESLLGRLNARDRSRVLETMMVEGSLVVVTQFLQGFEGFESWLRARLVEPGSPLENPPEAPPEESHGEFTRLFRSGSETPAPRAAEPTPQQPPPRAPASVPRSEFTDLFRAPAAPATQQPDPSTIPPVRMVGVRVPLPADPPSAPPPVSMPPLHRAEPPSDLVPPKLVPNFEASPEPAAPPDLAQWPRAEEVIIRVGEPAPPAPPAFRAGGAPSEYTRLFGSPPQPTGELAVPLELAESHPPQEEKTERKGSYLPLFVVLNVVFILATGLVLYFALRRC